MIFDNMPQPAEPVPSSEGKPDDVVSRETPQPDPAIANQVKMWCDRIRRARDHTHKKAFERMRKNMEYARLGASADWYMFDNYTANITQRHINQSVASLYARNPKATVKRRQRLDFELWDGTPESLQAAMMAATTPLVDPATGAVVTDAMGQPQVDPQAAALVTEVQTVMLRRKMLDKLGKTLEIMFNYYTNEQEPKFKPQFKQMVRRTKVCSVGYVELNFQRMLERNPEITSQIGDIQAQIQTLERISADLADGELDDDSPDIAQMKQQIEALQGEEMVIAREGLLFDFPRSTEIIPDPRTKQIKGWVGTGWIAREMHMSRDEIMETFKVDIKSAYTTYKPDERDKALDVGPATDEKGEAGTKQGLACVWKVQDKKSGTWFVICDGYPSFLEAPRAPDVKLERFFNIYGLTLNDIEDEKEIFPPSDVELITPMQEDINRSRQGLREHRKANRPAHAAVRGRLEKADKEALESRPAHAIVELSALGTGEKVGDLLQPVQGIPIDPAMYDTRPQFEDVLRVVGASQSTTFGNAGGDETATGEAIAQGARDTDTSSHVDDIDELLTELARGGGNVMLLNLDAATVKRIAGPGAVWPTLDRQTVAEEIYLDVKAGSSGRPNKAQELANRERAMPWLVQFPGLNPTPVLKDYLDLLEIDVEEAIIAGLPSITAMNAAAGKPQQPSTGDPKSDPNAQGGQGGQNAAQPAERQAGPQPAFPQAPTPMQAKPPGV